MRWRRPSVPPRCRAAPLAKPPHIHAETPLGPSDLVAGSGGPLQHSYDASTDRKPCLDHPSIYVHRRGRKHGNLVVARGLPLLFRTIVANSTHPSRNGGKVKNSGRARRSIALSGRYALLDICVAYGSNSACSGGRDESAHGWLHGSISRHNCIRASCPTLNGRSGWIEPSPGRREQPRRANYCANTNRKVSARCSNRPESGPDVRSASVRTHHDTPPQP